MASYSISQLKDDVGGFLHGANVSQVKNFYGVCRRAAQAVLSKIDPEDTIRHSQILGSVYEDIYDYTCPDDLKGKGVIDIRPQTGRTEEDSPVQLGIRQFRKYLEENGFYIQYNKGVKSLRLSVEGDTPITLHQMDSLTNNGTWAADGSGVKNLTQDQNNYLSGSASLNFDLDKDETSGYIENSTFDEVDLEDEEDIGALFVRVYIPDPDLITSFVLYWGSSASDYWYDTVTTPHDVSSFKTGWQILRFDWNGATESGSPDSSAIDYLKLEVNYSTSADETDLRVDRITCGVGKIYEIEYYSECLFEDSSGNWISLPTDDNDTINLDEDGYQIFFREVAKICAQQIGGRDAQADINDCDKELYGDGSRERPGLYHNYKVNHPSQRLRVRNYYWKKSTYDH